MPKNYKFNLDAVLNFSKIGISDPNFKDLLKDKKIELSIKDSDKFVAEIQRGVEKAFKDGATAFKSAIGSGIGDVKIKIDQAQGVTGGSSIDSAAASSITSSMKTLAAAMGTLSPSLDKLNSTIQSMGDLANKLNTATDKLNKFNPSAPSKEKPRTSTAEKTTTDTSVGSLEASFTLLANSISSLVKKMPQGPGTNTSAIESITGGDMATAGKSVTSFINALEKSARKAVSILGSEAASSLDTGTTAVAKMINLFSQMPSKMTAASDSVELFINKLVGPSAGSSKTAQAVAKQSEVTLASAMRELAGGLKKAQLGGGGPGGGTGGGGGGGGGGGSGGMSNPPSGGGGGAGPGFVRSQSQIDPSTYSIIRSLGQKLRSPEKSSLDIGSLSTLARAAEELIGEAQARRTTQSSAELVGKIRQNFAKFYQGNETAFENKIAEIEKALTSTDPKKGGAVTAALKGIEGELTKPGSGATKNDLGELLKISGKAQQTYRMSVNEALIKNIQSSFVQAESLSKGLESERLKPDASQATIQKVQTALASVKARIAQQEADLITNIEKGVVNKREGNRLRTTAGGSEFQPPGMAGAFFPQVHALVDTNAGKVRSDREKEYARWMEVLAMGTKEQVDALKQEQKFKGFDRVNIASEVLARMLLEQTVAFSGDPVAMRAAIGRATQTFRQLGTDVADLMPTGRDQADWKKGIRDASTRGLGQFQKQKTISSLDIGSQAQLLSRMGAAPEEGTGVAGKALIATFNTINAKGELIPKAFIKAKAAAQEMFSFIAQNTSGQEQFNEELEKAITLTKALKEGTPQDIRSRSRMVSYLTAAQKEMSKYGNTFENGQVATKPAALFGTEGFSKDFVAGPLAMAGGMDQVAMASDRAKNIFIGMKGTTKEIQGELSGVISKLTLAGSVDWKGQFDPRSIRETATALRGMLRDVSKGTVPKGLAREEAIDYARNLVEERKKALLSSGQNKMQFQIGNIPNVSGTGYEKLDITLKKVAGSFDQVSVKAKDAFSNIGGKSDLANAFRRVAIWGSAAGLLYGGINALRNAIGVMTDVETGVIKVGKVMDASSTNMGKFRDNIVNVSKDISTKFGTSIQSVLESMFTFAQQGLSLPDVTALTESTALAANVTNLSAPQAAEALTAAYRQFGMTAQDSMKILDSWNEVSNRTAIEENILAEATKRAGNAAATAGVSFHEYNGMVSAIGSATRQSGEMIATSMRFIFQRISRPAAESALHGIGIDVRDASGNVRGFVPIINDLSKKWDDLSNSQQLAIAQAIAGSRQYNTFLVLMDRFKDFVNDTAISMNSQGSAAKENAKVMESTAKQYAVLIEQVKQTAIELGDVFLPAAKGVIGILGGMVSALGALPSPIKAIVGGFAILGLASMKFADQIDMLLTGLSSIPQGAKGMAASLSGAFRTIGSAQDFSSLSAVKLASMPTSEVAKRAATIGVGDFEKGGAGRLSRAIPETFGFAMVGGETAAASQELSKFGAAVRGVPFKELGSKADAVKLGMSDMNSIFTKTLLLMAMTGQAIGGPVVAAFDRITGATKVYSAAAGTAKLASWGLWASLGPLVALAAALYGAYELVSWGYGKVTRSGNDVAQAMLSDKSAALEALSAARAYSTEVESLAALKDKLAKSEKLESNPRELADAKATRRYTPSSMFREDIAIRSSKAIGLLGDNVLDAAEGFDSFGNIILRDESLLKSYSGSVVEAAAATATLKMVGEAAAYASEINASSWYHTANAMERFEKISTKVKDTVKGFASGTMNTSDIGKVISSDSKGFRDSFKDQISEMRKAEAEVDAYGAKLKNVLFNLPKETPTHVFAELATSENGSASLEAMAKIANKSLGPAFGAVADKIDIVNAVMARTKTGMEQIGMVGNQTLAAFEKMGVEPIQISGDNASSILGQLKSRVTEFNNTIVLYRLPGESFLKQAATTLDEDGQLAVTVIDKYGALVQKSMQDLVMEAFDVKVIDKTVLSRTIQENALNIRKIVSGAGAGTVFAGDIKLGARMDFDMSSQQKVAQALPALYKEAYAYEQKYSEMLKEVGDRISKNVNIDHEFVAGLDKVASALNMRTTLIQVASDFTAIGQEAGKASDAIAKVKIEQGVDDLLASLKLGAENGIAENRRFKPTRLSSQLNEEDVFSKLFGKQIGRTQVGEQETKGLRTALISMTKLQEDLPKIGKEFEASQGRFAQPQDAMSLARTLLDAGNKDTALAQAVAGKSLAVQSQTLLVNQQTAKNTGDLVNHFAGTTYTQKEVLAGVDLGVSQAFKTLGAKQEAGPAGGVGGMQSMLGMTALKRGQENGVVAQVVREYASRFAASGEAVSPGTGAGLVESAKKRLLETKAEKESIIASLPVGASGRAADRPWVVNTQALATRQGAKESIDSINAALETMTRNPKGMASALETVLTNAVAGIRGERTKAGASAALGQGAMTFGDMMKMFGSMLGISRAGTEGSLTSVGGLTEFQKEVLSGAMGLARFQVALTKASLSVTENLSEKAIMDKISAPFAGALAGVAVQTPKDVGKEEIDLSPLERVNKAFPDMLRNFSVFEQISIPAAETAIKSAGRIISDDEIRLSDLRTDGSASALEAAKVVSQALQGEKQVRDNLVSSVLLAKSSMAPLADSIRQLITADTAAKKLEEIFRSLQQMSYLRFDSTSLDVALGRHPTSITPTKMGEPANLDKYARELFAINKQLQTGVSSSDYEKLSRRKQEIDFDREEAIIGYKQAKENSILDEQVSAAKQAMSTLYDAKERGVPGVEPLIATLKSQLESAGNTTFDGGQKYFEGIPALATLPDAMAGIKQALAEKQYGQQREIMLKPLEENTQKANEYLAKIQEGVAALVTPTGQEGGGVLGGGENLGVVAVGATKSLAGFGVAVDTATTVLLSIPMLINAISTGQVVSPIVPSSGKPNRFGGFISGPAGTDNVHSRLTAGEFVIPKSSAASLKSSFGPAVFSSLLAGSLPGFAGGGVIRAPGLGVSLGSGGMLDPEKERIIVRHALDQAIPEGDEWFSRKLESSMVESLGPLRTAKTIKDAPNNEATALASIVSKYSGAIGNYSSLPENPSQNTYAGSGLTGRLAFSNIEGSDMFSNESWQALFGSGYDNGPDAPAPPPLDKEIMDRIKSRRTTQAPKSAPLDKEILNNIKAWRTTPSYSGSEDGPTTMVGSPKFRSSQSIYPRRARLPRGYWFRNTVSPDDLGYGEYPGRGKFAKGGLVSGDMNAGVTQLTTMLQLARMSQTVAGDLAKRKSGDHASDISNIQENIAAIGNLADSIAIMSSDEASGMSQVRAGGMVFSAPTALVNNIQSSMYDMEKEVRAAQGGKERFAQSPMVNRLLGSTPDDSFRGAKIGETGAVFNRVAGTIGAGIMGSLEEWATPTESYARKKALENLGPLELLAAPFKAAWSTGQQVAALGAAPRGTDEEKRQFAVNAVLAGLTGAGALAGGLGIGSAVAGSFGKLGGSAAPSTSLIKELSDTVVSPPPTMAQSVFKNISSEQYRANLPDVLNAFGSEAKRIRGIDVAKNRAYAPSEADILAARESFFNKLEGSPPSIDKQFTEVAEMLKAKSPLFQEERLWASRGGAAFADTHPGVGFENTGLAAALGGTNAASPLAIRRSGRPPAPVMSALDKQFAEAADMLKARSPLFQEERLWASQGGASGVNRSSSLSMSDLARIFDEAEFGGFSKATGHRAGGSIIGAGGPTADIIPILASNGEYVVNARAARSIGLSRLEHMNRTGSMPRFKEGGLVGDAPSGGLSVDTAAISQALADGAAAVSESIKAAMADAQVSIKLPDNISDALTLRVPPEISNMNFGGPGAANKLREEFDALSSSLDIWRGEIDNIKNDLGEVKGGYTTFETVDKYVSDTLNTFRGTMETDINDRFGSLDSVKLELDSRINSKFSELNGTVQDVLSVATRAESSATQALSRSMLT
jgi:TP901 family phage tail tape measure protein